jgi:hypothetical protein
VLMVLRVGKLVVLFGSACDHTPMDAAPTNCEPALRKLQL